MTNDYKKIVTERLSQENQLKYQSVDTKTTLYFYPYYVIDKATESTTTHLPLLVTKTEILTKSNTH